MKPHKQTTSAVSSIAGKYVRMTNDMFALIVLGGTFPTYSREQRAFFRDIRKVCASALAQDEQKGQGKP